MPWREQRVDEVDLSEDARELWATLQELHYGLRDYTTEEFDRVNPFVENLFSWEEKGAYCGGTDVTIYQSATIAGDVSIGNHSWIGPFCSLDGTGGLSIGEYCSISAGSRILTHDTIRWSLTAGEAESERESLSIGEHCFVGVNSVITKGVDIGSTSVVAAGSLVNDSFDSNSVIAGSPAEQIGVIKTDGNSVTMELDK